MRTASARLPAALQASARAPEIVDIGAEIERAATQMLYLARLVRGRAYSPGWTADTCAIDAIARVEVITGDLLEKIAAAVPDNDGPLPSDLVQLG